MTGKRISAEQVKVMAVFTTEPHGWFDSNAIQRKAEVSSSSATHFLLALLKFGVLERLEVFPGYLYRLSPKAEAQPYFHRVQEAAAAMKP